MLRHGTYIQYCCCFCSLCEDDDLEEEMKDPSYAAMKDEIRRRRHRHHRELESSYLEKGMLGKVETLAWSEISG